MPHLLLRVLLLALILALSPTALHRGLPLLARAGSEPPRVGVIAGHAGFDSGASCPDGLSEVEVTRRATQALAGELARSGYRVEVLEEFDRRLPGYRAQVLLSLHADSCIPYSGFKVARLEASSIPAEDDRLVSCLYQEYGRVTGLPRHESTITHDMTAYHALQEKDPRTPGAIIEMGFLGGDREILLRQEVIARGLAQAVRCYLGAG